MNNRVFTKKRNDRGEVKLLPVVQLKHLLLLIAMGFALSACNNANNLQKDTQSENAKTPAAHNIELWPAIKSPKIFPESIEAKIDQLLSQMSVQEKVGQLLQAEIQTVSANDIKKYHIGSVLNGGGSIPRREERAQPKVWLDLADELYNASMDDSDGFLAIPIFWGTDAVHGNGNSYGATLFPHNIGLGAANNPELIRRIGEITAKEVRVLGLDWVFSPTVAVAQNDRWGRTYESYSENPDVVAQYARAMVEGLQGKVGEKNFLDEAHVIATAKHFLADGGTEEGDDQGNAQVSEAELVAIHNPGYVAAIEAGVQTIMASFSSWNGEKMHGNTYLLTDVLKQRMGFDGLIVGDWNGHGQLPGCTNSSCAKSVNAGLDIYMVTHDWKEMYDNLLQQIDRGEVPINRIDDAVRRILRVKIRAGLFDKKPSQRRYSGVVSELGKAEHRAVARQAVRESLVLLKNTNEVLPIAPGKTVLVAGPGADDIGLQSGGWSISWQGVTNANDNFPNAMSIFKGIETAVVANGGNAILSEKGKFKTKPDVAVVVFGEEPYAEGIGDINTLEFEPGNKKSLALLRKFKQQGIPTVSIFISGRPLWVNPEINASDAFVAAWLPGTEGGGIADVIVARADGEPNFDFKGRLSFSWPKTPLQEKLNPNNANYDPLFAYGYGLSYQSSEAGPDHLLEKVVGIETEARTDVELYNKRPLQPWNMYIRAGHRRQILSGGYAALSKENVTLETVDKELQGDALQFQWQDIEYVALTMEDGRPINLSRYVKNNGLIKFDLNIEEMTLPSITFEVRCGENCKRSLELHQYVREHIGKGWQRVAIPFSCFAQQSDSFDAVTVPFGLHVGGSGKFSVADIKVELQGEPTVECSNYDDLSISPEPLDTFWALSWWQRRHQEKLARIQQGRVDLLFIGDSITQGWEGEGKALWQQYYAPRNAVNLGYGGDRTENVLWRLQNGEVEGISPKVAVLMIGTNNVGHREDSAATVANGIKAILDELHSRLPDTKVLLLAIFPRSENASDFYRQRNEEINQLIDDFADNKRVFFLNINEKFIDSEGNLSRTIMPDLLHLSPQGYQIWAQAMEPLLQRLLGASN